MTWQGSDGCSAAAAAEKEAVATTTTAAAGGAVSCRALGRPWCADRPVSDPEHPVVWWKIPAASMRAESPTSAGSAKTTPSSTRVRQVVGGRLECGTAILDGVEATRPGCDAEGEGEAS